MKLFNIALVIIIIASCRSSLKEKTSDGEDKMITRRHMVLGDSIYKTYDFYLKEYPRAKRIDDAKMKMILGQKNWISMSRDFETKNMNELKLFASAENVFKNKEEVKAITNKSVGEYTFTNAYNYYLNNKEKNKRKREIIQSAMIGNWKYQHWQMISSAAVLSTKGLGKKESFDMYLNILRAQVEHETIMILYSYKNTSDEEVEKYYNLRIKELAEKEYIVDKYHREMRLNIISLIKNEIGNNIGYFRTKEFNSVVERAVASSKE